jgi:hypothetical protein
MVAAWPHESVVPGRGFSTRIGRVESPLAFIA